MDCWLSNEAKRKNTCGSGNRTDPNFGRDPNVFFVISVHSANYGSDDTGIGYQSGVGNTSQYGQYLRAPYCPWGPIPGHVILVHPDGHKAVDLRRINARPSKL